MVSDFLRQGGFCTGNWWTQADYGWLNSVWKKCWKHLTAPRLTWPNGKRSIYPLVIRQSHGAFQTKRGMLDSMEPNNDTSATCFRNVAVHDMSFQKSICLPLTILEYPTICHSLPLFTILKYGSSCCHYWPFWMPLQLPKSRMILQFFSPVGPRVSRVCPIASPIGVGQHLWSRARRLDRCFLSSWACCIPYMMQYI